ncbi:Poly [ADP-ribose] polymerase [Fusarium oxysporum f. sp. albedinis]|nr:Poly [ADP-ribose] polymerase [Fusarium oxysporum f. sp. albedinis]
MPVSLHHVLSCRTLYSAFPSFAQALLDHHFSMVQPPPAHQHPFDQLLAFLPLLSSHLLSVTGFFLPYAAGLVSHLPVQDLGPWPLTRQPYA